MGRGHTILDTRIHDTASRAFFAPVGLATPSAGAANSADNSTTALADESSDGLGGFSSEGNPFLFPLNLLEDNFPGEDNFSEETGASTEFKDVGLEDLGNKSTWWLLHTKPRQEKKLAEQLTRFGISHYLPATKHKALTRGRTRITWSPLFSGYFFLRGTLDQRLRALETNRLVTTHQVDDGEGLQARLWDLADLIEKGAPLTAEARLATGRRVRVKSGPFQNMEGTVIKRGGKTRLFIMVSQLLGGVSMEVEEHLLDPIF